MTDMIERVGVAIRLNLRSEGSCYRFADCFGLSKPFCECEQDVAVVALKAIREPTDDMMDGAVDVLGDCYDGTGTYLVTVLDLKRFFTAMIDTALKTEEKVDVIQS